MAAVGRPEPVLLDNADILVRSAAGSNPPARTTVSDDHRAYPSPTS